MAATLAQAANKVGILKHGKERQKKEKKHVHAASHQFPPVSDDVSHPDMPDIVTARLWHAMLAGHASKNLNPWILAGCEPRGPPFAKILNR